MQKVKRMLMVAFHAAVVSSCAWAANDCPNFGSQPYAAAEFLYEKGAALSGRSASVADHRCFEVAMKALARPEHADKAALVARFLDVQSAAWIYKGGVRRFSSPDIFPAIATLGKMGVAGWDGVVESVRSRQRSKAAVWATSEVLRYWFRDVGVPQGIQRLVKQGRSEIDNTSARLVYEQAADLAEHCRGDALASCRQALAYAMQEP